MKSKRNKEKDEREGRTAKRRERGNRKGKR